MKWIVLIVGSILLLTGAIWQSNRTTSDSIDAVNTVEIIRGSLTVRSVFEGKLESRNVVTVMSKFQGTATIIEIAPEGKQVVTGDLLVRFDASELERELVKLESDLTIAQANLNHILKGKHPLEIQEIKSNLTETSQALTLEGQFLADSRQLAAENLISMSEIEQQEIKVSRLQGKLDDLKKALTLTKEYIHPSEVETSKAQLLAANQALSLTREQIQNTTITAPSAGMVVYKPLHMNGEYRNVRVGDSIYVNQPFMMIPDLDNLVVRLAVPELELSRVKIGSDVLMQPKAYPEIELQGVIENISAIAQSIPGLPQWQKYFIVIISLDKADEHLRPGMSVVAHVVSYETDKAILIPRRAIKWESGFAKATFINAGNQTISRALGLGEANEIYYEILEGAKPGEQVLLQ